MWAEIFSLALMGGRVEGLMCADPGAKTPIGARRNLLVSYVSLIGINWGRLQFFWTALKVWLVWWVVGCLTNNLIHPNSEWNWGCGWVVTIGFTLVVEIIPCVVATTLYWFRVKKWSHSKIGYKIILWQYEVSRFCNTVVYVTYVRADQASTTHRTKTKYFNEDGKYSRV